MPILNYTTDVAAEKSVAEITQLLTRHGANKILTDIQNGEVVAIAVQIHTPDGLMGFRLPVEWQRVVAVLEQQKEKARRKGERFRAVVNEEQAKRVGWRIVKQWLEAQLALIETQMVTLDQVFLPYAVTKSGGTLYQEMKESKYLLLGGSHD